MPEPTDDWTEWAYRTMPQGDHSRTSGSKSPRGPWHGPGSGEGGNDSGGEVWWRRRELLAPRPLAEDPELHTLVFEERLGVPATEHGERRQHPRLGA